MYGVIIRCTVLYCTILDSTGLYWTYECLCTVSETDDQETWTFHASACPKRPAVRTSQLCKTRLASILLCNVNVLSDGNFACYFKPALVESLHL
ncbi:hypothetical protein K504DRAFT_456679, partial [Pleomassaria siparia CBS 279.74]